MPNIPSKDQCEQRAINVTVDTVNSKSFHNWQNISQSNDDGIDGLIFIRNRKEEKTGELVFVQIKGGLKNRGYYKTYKSRPNKICLNLGSEYIESHYPRWYNFQGPVILVFVEYSSSKAYWTDLKHPDSYSDSNKSIVIIDKKNRFGEHSFGEFKKLKGYTYISRDIELLKIELTDTNYINFVSPDSIKEQAKEYYKNWCYSSPQERTNPKLGEIIVSRVGWRHITRSKRKKSRIMQSLQLLGLAKKIIQETKTVWQVKVLDEKILSDGTILITDFLGLRANVKFTFRGATVIQVLLKRKRFINKISGKFTSEIRFYSVYEPLINRDI